MRRLCIKITLFRYALLFTATLLAGCSGEAARKRAAKLDDAIIAIRKIESAVEVGVNYQQYTALLVEAKAKVDLANDFLPAGELRTQLSDTLENYADAGSAWGRKFHEWEWLDTTDRVGNSLIEKYSLPVSGRRFGDFEDGYYNRTGIDFDPAMQEIWRRGHENLDRLISLQKH